MSFFDQPCLDGFQRGSEIDGYACIPCDSAPSGYDICYLVFWLFVVEISHLISVATISGDLRYDIYQNTI